MGISLLYIVIGFVALVKGADILIQGAASLARRFHISDLVIGLTVVAFGTSCPELFVNVVASIQGNAGIALGNIIGSNIANILLVLGVAACIFPLEVGKGTAFREIPFSIVAAIFLYVLGFNFRFHENALFVISRLDALFFIILFAFFLWYSWRIAYATQDMPEAVPEKTLNIRVSCVFIFVGLFGLTLGAHWINISAVSIARFFGVNDTIIGLTIVAVGTCLPELATSIVAAYKKNPSIAIGNVVGSNIFNIFFVLGITGLIRPVASQKAMHVDMLVMIVATIILFFSMYTGKRRVIDRWEGFCFCVAYAAYIIYLVFTK